MSTLVPEKDWSLRIAAMQRVEGLVFGGYTNLNFILLLTFHMHPICVYIQILCVDGDLDKKTQESSYHVEL